MRRLLEQRIDDCLAGRGSLLLLAGEPGIGKTRTLGWLADQARTAGIRTVQGACSEVPGAPALLPWMQILRDLGREGPSRCRGLEVERSIGWRDDEARFRLFRAIADALIDAARTGPLLLAIDDLHAADEASAGLLAFLTPELEAVPLLVAAAYRDADVPSAHRLRPTLEELARHAHVALLQPMEETDVQLLADATAEAPVEPAVVRALYERSQGNPLFAKQLLEYLIVVGDDLRDPTAAERVRTRAPEGVRQVLRRRVERLDTSAHDALRLAAAAGREFDSDIVELAASLLALPVAVASLDAAASARIVEPQGALPGCWRFVHVLFRDVLYEGLTPSERRVMHDAVGRAIAQRRDLEEDVWLAAAAYHGLQSMTAQTAAGTRALAWRAGQCALARRAHEDAVEWFEGALRALELDPERPDGEGERLRLLIPLATARWRCGQTAAARRDFLEAMEVARRRGDALAFAEAAVGFVGRTDTVLGPEDEQARVLDEALGRLDDAPSRLRVDVLTRLATALYFSGDAERRNAVSREAVACAESLRDPAALVYALTARHYVLVRPGTLREREEISGRTRRLLKSGAEDSPTAIAHFQSILDGLERGDFARVDRHARMHAAIADRLREPFLRWQQAAIRATRALAAGRLTEGEALARRALALGEEAESPNAMPLFSAQIYGVRRAQGRLGELEPILADLAGQFPDVPGYTFARAEAQLALGRRGEACEFLVASGRAGFRDLPCDFSWYSVVSVVTRCVTKLEQVSLAEAVYELLRPLDGTCVVMPFGSLWDGAVALYLGQLALLLDRSAEARRHLESAALLHSRVGARAHLAETWLARARLRAREGEEEAARDAREAAALYRDLGMAEGEAEAESLSRTRVRAVPEPDATHRLVRRGKSWYVRFAGNETRLPDSLGLAYLAALISRRDEVVHVLELTGRRRGGDADSGPMLDARARTAVRARLQALREDVEEARARNDLGSAEVAGSELERLEAELIGALGLGGRSRRVGDPVERARKAVYNRIRAATRSIEGELPDLGRHLRRSVRTGRTCMYAPDAPVRWIVEV